MPRSDAPESVGEIATRLGTEELESRPAGRDPWESDVVSEATLGDVTGSPPSTKGGMRGTVSFEVSQEIGSQLFAVLGQRAFDLTFAKCHLGDGYSAASVRGRPDAKGEARAFVVFNAPEEGAPKLGGLFTRGLIGRKATLVIGRSQVTMADLLARAKAEGQTTLEEAAHGGGTGDPDGDLLP